MSTLSVLAIAIPVLIYLTAAVLRCRRQSKAAFNGLLAAMVELHKAARVGAQISPMMSDLIMIIDSLGHGSYENAQQLIPRLRESARKVYFATVFVRLERELKGTDCPKAVEFYREALQLLKSNQADAAVMSAENALKEIEQLQRTA